MFSVSKKQAKASTKTLAAEVRKPAPAGALRTNLQTFGILIRDTRVSHGAFRLWHELRDHTNHLSKCWPGQRRISEDIGCDLHSLKGWTQELVEAGWLRLDFKTGRAFTYTVLNGLGEPLRKPTTPTVAERHNTDRCGKAQHGVAETHNTVLRESTTQVSPSSQSIKSGGEQAPPIERKISDTERISREQELDRARDELARIRRNCAADATGTRFYDATEKKRIAELKPRISELTKLLGRVA